MAFVNLTDRPKSVRNRCVIEVFVTFCVITFPFGGLYVCKGFIYRTELDLFFFLFTRINASPSLGPQNAVEHQSVYREPLTSFPVKNIYLSCIRFFNIYESCIS